MQNGSALCIREVEVQAAEPTARPPRSVKSASVDVNVVTHAVGLHLEAISVPLCELLPAPRSPLTRVKLRLCFAKASVEHLLRDRLPLCYQELLDAALIKWARVELAATHLIIFHRAWREGCEGELTHYRSIAASLSHIFSKHDDSEASNAMKVRTRSSPLTFSVSKSARRSSASSRMSTAKAIRLS